MEILHFTFRLGVVFAIYSFIWGLVEIGISLLSAGRKRKITEIYILKAVKYFFLVNVVYLITVDASVRLFSSKFQWVFGGIVLLLYFIGKFQNSQQKSNMFQVMGDRGSLLPIKKFNFRLEIIVILVSLGCYIAFYFYPVIAKTAIPIWFKTSILDIESTPIFGFIFRVIGFFFLLNILMKLVNSFLFILSGEAFSSGKNTNIPEQNDDFDDYEEVE